MAKHKKTIKSPKEKSNKSEQNGIENYIKIYNNIIDDDLCDLIIEEYEKSEEWENISERCDVYHNFERSYDVITMSIMDSILKNVEKRKKIDELIYEVISKSKELYAKEFEYLNIQIDTGFDLLRYKKNSFYSQHTDDFKDRQRSIACSIQLNENYEGGEFTFFDRKISIKPTKSSIIMFPSNFMYPHEILPVTKGTRYSIVTWLV
jgi:Rps23 Pro-64 3,4-dihydroxylase Tpa1-like proline 4-hydroxylase